MANKTSINTATASSWCFDSVEKPKLCAAYPTALRIEDMIWLARYGTQCNIPNNNIVMHVKDMLDSDWTA